MSYWLVCDCKTWRVTSVRQHPIWCQANANTASGITLKMKNLPSAVSHRPETQLVVGLIVCFEWNCNRIFSISNHDITTSIKTLICRTNVKAPVCFPPNIFEPRYYETPVSRMKSQVPSDLLHRGSSVFWWQEFVQDVQNWNIDYGVDYRLTYV